MTPREAELRRLPAEWLAFLYAAGGRVPAGRLRLDRAMAAGNLNISSKGLLFTTRFVFVPGQVVEAFIDFPIRLHDRVRPTQVVEGAIGRSGGNPRDVT
jgi:hypothetical protein